MKFSLAIYLLTALVSLSSSSCSSKKRVTKLDDDIVKYGLKKGPCFGTCPVFELKIYEGGKAILEAGKFTEKPGTLTKRLSEEHFAEIEEAFAKYTIHNLPDEYESNIPDLPSVWITHHNGNSSKTVFGKEGRPDQLLELQELLENVYKSEGWSALNSTVTKADKEESPIIKNELIVQPYDNQINEAWLAQYKRYGLKLEKKLAPDLDYFLLSFDSEKIDPDVMLEKIKADKAIRLAEFNRNIKSRPMQGKPK